MYHERTKVDPLVWDRRRGDEKLRSTFLPNRVSTIAVEDKDLAAQSKLVPLLEGKVTRGGLPTVYVSRSVSASSALQNLIKSDQAQVPASQRIVSLRLTPKPERSSPQA